MTLDKLSNTLADVQELATIVLHVCDAPIIHATQLDYIKSQTMHCQVWRSCKTSSNEGHETTP